MDILHYILVVIIIVLVIVNNLSGIRKYYYPWFFSNMKSLSKTIQSYWKNNNLPKKKYKSEAAKKAELYSSLSFKQLKIIQRKLAWKYQVAVMNLNCNLNIGAIYRSGCLLGMDKYLIMGIVFFCTSNFNTFALVKLINFLAFLSAVTLLIYDL